MELKIISFILTFYILVSTVIPCAVFDNCENEFKTSRTTEDGKEKNCNACSPFSFCCNSHTITTDPDDEFNFPEFSFSSPLYESWDFHFKPAFRDSLFQPPRLS